MALVSVRVKSSGFPNVGRMAEAHRVLPRRYEMKAAFFQQLRARHTLLMALVVGTLINVYGHVLVPFLRGQGNVSTELGRNFAEAPLVAVASIALGCAFPWLVSAYAGARARVEIGTAASLAQFNLKPDPVFRARHDGVVVEAGAQTRVMFGRHRLDRAQDILGSDLWSRIAVSIGHDGLPPAPETVYFAPADQWYVVAAARAPDGINIYLAVVPSGARGTSDRPGLKSA